MLAGFVALLFLSPELDVGPFFEQGAVEAFGLPLIRGRTPKPDSQAEHLGGCPIQVRAGGLRGRDDRSGNPSGAFRRNRPRHLRTVGDRTGTPRLRAAISRARSVTGFTIPDTPSASETSSDAVLQPCPHPVVLRKTPTPPPNRDTSPNITPAVDANPTSCEPTGQASFPPPFPARTRITPPLAPLRGPGPHRLHRVSGRVRSVPGRVAFGG